MSSAQRFDDFTDQTYRLPSNADFDDTDTAVTDEWIWDDSSLADGGPVGVRDGLSISSGRLVYPLIGGQQLVLSGSALACRRVSGSIYHIGHDATANNPPLASGIRTYYRFFDLSPLARCSFLLGVYGSATPIAYSDTLANDSDEIKICLKLPNAGGEGTGWLDVMQWFATGIWTDGAGVTSGQTGAFRLNEANDVTVGARSTGSLSVNGKVFIRITVPSGWIGYLDSIALAG